MYLQYSIFKPAGRTVSICVIAEGKALVILLWQSCNWFAFGIMAVYVIRSSPSDVEFDILMNLGKVWHCSHWCKNNPASLVASSAGALRRNGSLGNTHASSMHQAMSQTQSQTLRSRPSPALAHLGCAHTWNGNVQWALETRMQDCSNPRHVLFGHGVASKPVTCLLSTTAI